MTKSEFIEKLRAALENDLDSRTVQENVAYYSAYIDEEVRKGRRESEVLAELGDPWVIAKSVTSMAENQAGEGARGEADSGYGYESARGGREQYTSGTRVHSFTVDSWWKKLLAILVIVGIVLIVFAIVGGILSLIMPVLVPILVVILLVRFIQRLR